MAEELELGSEVKATRGRASSRIVEYDSTENIQASSSLKLENLSDAKPIKPAELKLLIKKISDLE